MGRGSYPPELSDPVDDRLYNWIVIDTQSIQYDWIPAELRASMEKHYEPAGQLPFFDQATRPRALVPVTGAEKWPIYLWTIKTPGGKRPAATATQPAAAPPTPEPTGDSLFTTAEDGETSGPAVLVTAQGALPTWREGTNGTKRTDRKQSLLASHHPASASRRRGGSAGGPGWR